MSFFDKIKDVMYVNSPEQFLPRGQTPFLTPTAQQ